MGMMNVREIDLIGKGVVAKANLSSQLSELIQRYDGKSLPLLPRAVHAYSVRDRRFPQATHLFVEVDEDGDDATLRRHVRDSLDSLPTHEALLEDNALPKQRLSESGPVYFVSEENGGYFLDRIIYRRGCE